MTKAPENKIGVPFHPLTEEELKEWYQKKYLTTAGYLLAIKKVTRPPGVDLKIPNVLEFCRYWGIAKSAFYRAVSILKVNNDMDWEPMGGIILKTPEKVVSLFPEEKCPTSGTVSHERDGQSHERDGQSHSWDSQSHEWENRSPKPLRHNNSSSPQTITDFIKTLSDSERESFEKFVREEWRKLKGEEIVSIERFLARDEDIKNWHEKFLNSPAGQTAKAEAIAAQFNWRNDPRFDDWIWKAFNGGYPWTQEDEVEREQRYTFYEWAQNTNAYEGVCC